MKTEREKLTGKRKSIAARWFVNSFSVIALIMLIVTVGIYYTAKSYYYNMVSQFLSSNASIIVEVITRFYETSPSGYTNEVREAVEYFDKKNVMELMAIDSQGNIQISSSGFSIENEDEMPDYVDAMTNESGIGEYIGTLDRSSVKEKYMAVSVRIDAEKSEYSAIRVMSSLEKVDERLFGLIAMSLAVSVFILLLVLFMGLYFVTSILSPIREMSKSAKKLAKGDFSERIEIKKNDEIGDLCQTFNNMANELANSERIKNDFISSVSHELRTPLTAIKGWSETIMEMKDPEMLSKGMRVITTETERLSSMVEELLDFSRIQNKRLLLQRTNMDILAELADAVLICTERALKNNTVITYLEPDGVAMIYGDKNRLRQVFLNILDNAIKYTGADGLINVEAHLKSGSVEIKVSDNGCGISEADLPKVKTRFYKANNTIRGSGIGLAVADELVGLHGGTLDIESKLGEGTTVIVELPTIQKIENKIKDKT